MIVERKYFVGSIISEYPVRRHYPLGLELIVKSLSLFLKFGHDVNHSGPQKSGGANR